MATVAEAYQVGAEQYPAVEVRKIETFKGYTAHARYLAECSEEPVREVRRHFEIPSPYAFSQSHITWRHASGAEIFIVETRHRHFEVFEVVS